ncbi:somatostatin receptor type 4-like [Symsagittifera roscoffensis]|uniref:somatostatin receptor type 4-like n=1 Tax=Symsagittifera roscoffensis TaxID=84072 RepID=UPI00307BDA5C
MIFTKILMPLLFVFGVGANLSALYMLKRQWKKIQQHIVSHTLVHLAVSDIIYLSVLGVMSWEQLTGKIISPYLCKPKFFFDVLSQHVSAWLIVTMSHERYQAMNNPYAYNSTYQTKNAIALVFVWISGLVVSAPIGVFTAAIEEPYPDLGIRTTANTSVLHCGSTWNPVWKSVYFSSLAVMECLLPVSLMVFFYIGVFKNFLRQIRNPRSALAHINQNRLSAVLGLIVVSFIVSYGPFYISQMVNEFHLFANHQVAVIYMTVVFQILTYVNSCLSPILYSGFTKKFMLIRDLADSSPPGANYPVVTPCDDDDDNEEHKVAFVPSTSRLSCEVSNKNECTGA